MKSGQNLLQTTWQIQTSTLNRVIDYESEIYRRHLSPEHTRMYIHIHTHTTEYHTTTEKP